MTEEEARQLTDEIKGAAEKIWALLLTAHERKAWTALGYVTWEAYIKAEFDMGRAHSYRLIDQGRVIREIGAAAGLSPMGDITLSEREARDIKPHLEDVVARVQERILSVPQEQIAQVVQQVVAKERERITAERESRAAFQKMEEDGIDLSILRVTPDDQARVNVIFGFYDALDTILALPSPEDAVRMVDTCEQYHLERLPDGVQWLTDFAKAWEARA
jgi:hypothetical protein